MSESRMDTGAPFVIQKPNQWDSDPEEEDGDGCLPPPYYPHTGNGGKSFPRKPPLQPQHPNLVEENDYISEPETPDDLGMDIFKRAHIINLREVRGAANTIRVSPKTSPTSRPGLQYYSNTSTISSDDPPTPVSANGRMPDLRASLSSSSTSSLSSTLSSVSATSTVGNRQLKLRVTSVLLGPDGHSSGLLTPVMNDSYEELIKSLRLIHDIDDDLQIEVINRGTGGRLSQATMSDLRMNDVLDIVVFKSLYKTQPLPPPHQPLPPAPIPSPVSASAPISDFPTPIASTSSPTSQPKAQPSRLPQRANTQHTLPNIVFDHPHPMPSVPVTHVNSHTLTSPPPSSPPSSIFSHGFSSFNTSRSRSPQTMSPAMPSFMRRSSVQARSSTPTQTRSPTPTQIRSPILNLTRSPTPTSGGTLRRTDTVSSTFSVSSVNPPAYSDFYLIISPPLYEKGHNSVFPAKPFTLTRTHDGVFTISTVSSILDVLKKKFPECPEVIFYHADTELSQDKRLCDMGIVAGTKLRLVDRENYRLVPARLHDSFLEVMSYVVQ